MRDGPDIARVAALIGDPARAAMLSALMTGQALTASELAAEGGVSAPTASGHLGRLREAGLVRDRKQGRHRYFALAGPEVGLALEALMGLAAATGPSRSRPGPRDPALRRARVCYDHLAGECGTALYDWLLERDHLRPGDTLPELTPGGAVWAEGFGIDLGALRAKRAPLCRDCLDWSARRSHLGGSLGRAILARMVALGWLRQAAGSRALIVLPPGARGFQSAFGIRDL